MSAALTDAPSAKKAEPDRLGPPEPPADDLQTIATTARQLGIHRDTLYKLAARGDFPPAVKIGARWLVSVPRLERFLHGEGQK